MGTLKSIFTSVPARTGSRRTVLGFEASGSHVVGRGPAVGAAPGQEHGRAGANRRRGRPVRAHAQAAGLAGPEHGGGHHTLGGPAGGRVYGHAPAAAVERKVAGVAAALAGSPVGADPVDPARERDHRAARADAPLGDDPAARVAHGDEGRRSGAVGPAALVEARAEDELAGGSRSGRGGEGECPDDRGEQQHGRGGGDSPHGVILSTDHRGLPTKAPVLPLNG